MTLTTDHSFHIGEQHLRNGKPNQDYARSGTLNDDIAYAIVSDGCSSGGQTDIGARLLTLATERAIKDNDALFVDQVRDTYAEVFRSTLDLEHRDLLATNLYAIVSPAGIDIHVTGDGVVALCFEQGMYVNRLSWDQNMPYYPAYRLAGQDASFEVAHATADTPLTLEISRKLYWQDEVEAYGTSELTTSHGMSGVALWQGDQNPFGQLTAIGLFSDGVEQVDGYDTFAVVDALMSFKSTSGQFATRRMNRFLREAKQHGRGPLDDIAMAVIHLGRDTAVKPET